MISTGKVIEVYDDKAKVLFIRESACGGNCSSCAGCGGRTLTAEVINCINAKPGDKVLVESKTSKVLLSAFLVYIFPLVVFILCYVLLNKIFEMEKKEIKIKIKKNNEYII